MRPQIEWNRREGGARRYEFSGASVLLAGATGGIGAELAGEFAARGADLTLVGRSGDKLGALPVAGARSALDLRSPEACEEAIGTAVARHGRLDAVVNATGVVAFGSVDELSIDALEELLLTNTVIPVLLAKAALPHLSTGGVIVNIPGVIAEANVAGMAAYGASKAAVSAFDQALAREARRRKVRVIDARPPHTETELSDHPIEGTAPRMGAGLPPRHVAERICDAIAEGTTDLPSTAFAETAGARP